MATARRQGNNVNVSTFDDTGSPDYTDLATWEAATDTDLVTADISERLELQQNKIYSHNVDLAFDGATTDSDHIRTLAPAASAKHDGTNNGAGFSTTTDLALSFNENFFQVHDIVVQMTNGTASTGRAIRLRGDETAAIGCIVDTPTSSSGATAGIGGVPSPGEVTYAIDCLVYDCDDDGILQGGTTTMYVYNCTVINSASDDYVGGGMIAKNCVSQDGGTGFTSVTTTTCLASDASGDIQATLTFKDKANDDYHLVASDTAAIDAGTDLSSDTNYAFDDDVDGDLWGSSWDIGFDSFSTISGSLLSVLGIG